MRFVTVLVLLLVLGSCTSSIRRDQVDSAMFAPVALRVHPIFTEPKDWTGDGKVDGVEALIQLIDQFDDPTKARGQIVFELFARRRYSPDSRGQALETWTMPLYTLAEQNEHWRRIGGAYAFQLPFPQLAGYGATVLSAEMTLAGGGRLRDQIVLSGK
jgi:hypothetical protein